MRYLLLLFFLVVLSCGPTPSRSPFSLVLPAGWSTEHIPFPISFAPTLPYSGTENAYFSPGWGSADSAEYWSYAFLWWLNGSVAFDTASLRADLFTYYDGLVRSNIQRRAIPYSSVSPTSVFLDSSLSGTVSFFDYLGHKPILLNCRLRLVHCGGHTALLANLSPQPFSGPVLEVFLGAGFFLSAYRVIGRSIYRDPVLRMYFPAGNFTRNLCYENNPALPAIPSGLCIRPTPRLCSRSTQKLEIQFRP